MAKPKKLHIKTLSRHKPTLLKRGSAFSKPQLVIFILAFGLIGYLLYKSFADAPLIESLEAEQMALSSEATVVDDAAASAGKVVKLAGADSLGGSVSLPTAANTISVRVKADKCRNKAPSLSLLLDNTVAGPHRIASTDWTSWTIHRNLARGLHTINLTVANTSTANCATQLFVDAVNFYGPLAVSVSKPSLTFEAKPTAITAGTASTLNWNVTDADSCSASGDWSGPRPIHGSVSTGSLKQTAIYNLTCTGTAGSVSSIVKVTVIPATAPSSIVNSRPLYGYSVHILDQPDADSYLSLASNGGAATIRDRFDWKSFEPQKGVMDWTEPDRLMSLAAKHNLRMLMVLGTTPDWARGTTLGANSEWQPPKDPEDYGAAAGKLAARYGAGGSFWAEHPSIPKVLPTGIEIWNEPNIKTFWGGANSNPILYTAMAKSAYRQIKSADPSMAVVAGALSAGETNSSAAGYWLSYLKQMYANGLKGNMDALSLHLFAPNEGTSVNQVVFGDKSAWQTMAEDIRVAMVDSGDANAKIWITQTGVPTNQAPEPAQADVAAQEMALWKSYSWSGNFYWADLKDSCGDKNNPACALGTLRANNSPKLIYDVLKATWSNVAQAK